MSQTRDYCHDVLLSSVDDTMPGQRVRPRILPARHVSASLQALAEVWRPAVHGEATELRRTGMQRGRLRRAALYPGLVLEALPALEGQRRSAGHSAARARIGKYQRSGLHDRHGAWASAGQCPRHPRTSHRAVRQDRAWRASVPLVRCASHLGHHNLSGSACPRLGSPRLRQAEQ